MSFDVECICVDVKCVCRKMCMGLVREDISDCHELYHVSEWDVLVKLWG